MKTSSNINHVEITANRNGSYTVKAFYEGERKIFNCSGLYPLCNLGCVNPDTILNSYDSLKLIEWDEYETDLLTIIECSMNAHISEYFIN